MAKFYGPIGFAVPTETRPGVWKDEIEEYEYFGDVLKNSSRWTASQEGTNDDLTTNNQISIIIDPFAENHFHCMKYVKWMGAVWKITNVDIRPPRLVISVGGVYSGPQKS